MGADSVHEAAGEERQAHVEEGDGGAKGGDAEDLLLVRKGKREHLAPESEIHLARENFFFHGGTGHVYFSLPDSAAEAGWVRLPLTLSAISRRRSSASTPWICQSRRYKPSCWTSSSCVPS